MFYTVYTEKCQINLVGTSGVILMNRFLLLCI